MYFVFLHVFLESLYVVVHQLAACRGKDFRCGAYKLQLFVQKRNVSDTRENVEEGKVCQLWSVDDEVGDKESDIVTKLLIVDDGVGELLDKVLNSVGEIFFGKAFFLL